MLTEKRPLQDIAQGLGLPLMDLDALDLEHLPPTLLDEKRFQTLGIMPLFKRGNHLFLALSHPFKQETLKEIQFHTGLQTQAILVETHKFHCLLAKDVRTQDLTSSLQNDDAPVVKFVHQILIDAIKKEASDIHFEPYENNYRIRYRLDGILVETAFPPQNLCARITARIKIMSNLDISEKRIPQDGRFKMMLSDNRTMDFRVSTCPTVNGEKVVIRILDPISTQRDIESLGFNALQKAQFLKAIQKSQGMILVTGPTGSGKTVTLYSALQHLNTCETNILTIEDPVEIKMAGINQVHINPKAGLTFSNTLRSFLRQDPDIIMVGEIRDLETAEIAIKAAQTGHMVLSTLHTNSAAETLNRLITMGLRPFNIASAVSLLLAQRLARRLCEYCKLVCHDLSPQNLMEWGFSEKEAVSFKPFKAVGCRHCHQGYKGRLGLFEIMPMTKRLGELIQNGAASKDIQKKAQEEGMITLYQAGLNKVKEGLTTLEEINRVTVDEA